MASPSLSPSPSPLFSSSVPEREAAAAAAAAAAVSASGTHHHHRRRHHRHEPTPLHPSSGRTPKKLTTDIAGGAVSCSDCRFSSSSTSTRRLPPSSPRALIRSLFLSITRLRTPRSSSPSSSTPGDDAAAWRLAAADLSTRLVAASRTRDEALRETSRLKSSLAELERKFSVLESNVQLAANSFPFDTFLRSVSSSRSAVRLLARSLAAHLRNSTNHHQMECFLTRVFFSDFELDFDGVDAAFPDPADRCASSLAAFRAIESVAWDDVLLKGTRHFSAGLSRFCDAKMSGVVASLGWPRSRAWPEPLLQAFFLAAKGVWALRLLARSVHPPLPVIRAERGARFDGRFMEDIATGLSGVGRLDPAAVKMMVAPGFHVYVAGAGVVKCKVVCSYNGRSNGGHKDGGSVKD